MPYLKCVPCRIRVPAGGVDLVDGACPGCGQPLDTVARVSDVMGFRAPASRDPSARHPERPSDITGGRAAAEAQLETDRWLDEGGSLPPELLAGVVALPVRTP